jgi:toxin CptA
VQLLSGSTLWPWLLALRVRACDGAVRHVLIAPDSVARGQFRPLAVALRTLAARGAPPASPQ